MIVSTNGANAATSEERTCWIESSISDTKASQTSDGSGIEERISVEVDGGA